MLLEVNFLAVFVVTILNVLIGMLWYSPTLEKDSIETGPWHYIAAFVISFVLVYVFALLINWLGITKVVDGVKLGILLWVGFIATTNFSAVIWAKKPWMAFFIDAGYHLVSMIVIGAILAAWQ
jgi:hypothetical protein